jgi:hypothetical protein
MWMIDTPSPFAPRAELEAFLREMATGPTKDSPEAKEAVAEVQRYLMHGNKGPSPEEVDAARQALKNLSRQLRTAASSKSSAQQCTPTPVGPPDSTEPSPEESPAADQNPPFMPSAARVAPAADLAMGTAFVRLGIKHGELWMVRRGRELQQHAIQQQPDLKRYLKS